MAANKLSKEPMTARRALMICKMLVDAAAQTETKARGHKDIIAKELCEAQQVLRQLLSTEHNGGAL